MPKSLTHAVVVCSKRLLSFTKWEVAIRNSKNTENAHFHHQGNN